MAESIGGNRTRRSDKYAQQAADALQILSGLKGNSETLEISADNAKAKAIMEDTEKAAKKMRKNVEEPIEINISDDDVFNSRDIQKRVKDITDSLRNAAESIQNGGKLSQKETEGFVKQYYELGKYLEKVGQEVPEQISQAYQKITNSLRNRNADIFKGKWAINENPDLEQFYKRINEKSSKGDLSYRAQGEAEYRKIWGSATRTINRELSQEIENTQISETMEQLDRLEERAKQVGDAVQAMFTTGINSDASDEYLQGKIDQLEQYLDEINEISDEINNLQISSKNKTLISKRDELKNQLSSARGINYNISDNINSIIAERREAEAKAIEEQEQRIRDAQNSIEALIRNHEDFADYGKESWVQKYKDKLKEDGADLTSVYNEFVAEITEAKRTAQEALSKQQARDSRRTEIEDFFSQISGGDPDKLKEYMKKYVSEMNQIINDASQSIAEFKDRVAKELGLSYGGSGGIGGTNGSGGTNTMTDEPQEFEEQAEREEEAWKKAEQKWESVEEVRKRIISQHRNKKFEDDDDYNHYLTYDSSFSNDYDYKKDEYEYVDKLIDDAKQEENRLEELNRVLDKLQEKREGIQNSIRSAEDGGYGYDIQHLDDKQWGEPEYVKGELSVLEDYYKQLLEIDDLISYVQDQKSQAAINFKPGDAWGTQEIQVLIELLQSLSKEIANISKAFGQIDDQAQISPLLEQLRDIGAVIDDAFSVDNLSGFIGALQDISEQLTQISLSIGVIGQGTNQSARSNKKSIRQMVQEGNKQFKDKKFGLDFNIKEDASLEAEQMKAQAEIRWKSERERYRTAFEKLGAAAFQQASSAMSNEDALFSALTLNNKIANTYGGRLDDLFGARIIANIEDPEKAIQRYMDLFKIVNQVLSEYRESVPDVSVLKKNLKLGDKGASIKDLQKKLKLQSETLGDLYDININGEFDQATQNAVLDFQKRFDIKGVSGEVNQNFMNKLDSLFDIVRNQLFEAISKVALPSSDMKSLNAVMSEIYDVSRTPGEKKSAMNKLADTLKTLGVTADIEGQDATVLQFDEVVNKLTTSLTELQSVIKSGLGLESIEGEEGKFTSFLSQIIEKMGQLEQAAKQMAEALSGAMKDISLSEEETSLGKKIQDAIDSQKPYLVDVKVNEESKLANQIKDAIDSESYKIKVEPSKPTKQKTEREHEVIRPTSDGGMVRHSIKTSTGEQPETSGTTTAINATGEAAESADTSVKRLKKDIEDLAGTKPVNPLEKMADDGASISGTIQEAINTGNPYQIEIKPQATLLDAIQTMLDGKEFQIKAGVSVIGSGESPAELITQMVGADAIMGLVSGKSAIKERGMAFNSKTGYHTNPFIFDDHGSFSSKLTDTILSNVSEDVDTWMHTHPELYPAFSLSNKKQDGHYSGDLRAAYSAYKNKGIKTEINAAQNQVAVFDAQKFYDMYGNLFDDANIDNTMEQIYKARLEVEEKFKKSFKSLADVFNIESFDIPFEQLLGKNFDAPELAPKFKEMLSEVWKNATGDFDATSFTRDFMKYINTLPSDYSGSIKDVFTEYIRKTFSDLSIEPGEIEKYLGDGSDFKTAIGLAFEKWFGELMESNAYKPRIQQLITPEILQKSLGIADFDKNFMQYLSIDRFKHAYSTAVGSTDPYSSISASAIRAASAKQDFAGANREAAGSVDPTTNKLKEEELEFNAVADTAKSAADAKGQFTDANKNAAISEKDTGLENLTEEEKLVADGARKIATDFGEQLGLAKKTVDALTQSIQEMINSLLAGDLPNVASSIKEILSLDSKFVHSFGDNDYNQAYNIRKYLNGKHIKISDEYRTEAGDDWNHQRKLLGFNIMRKDQGSDLMTVLAEMNSKGISNFNLDQSNADAWRELIDVLQRADESAASIVQELLYIAGIDLGDVENQMENIAKNVNPNYKRPEIDLFGGLFDEDKSPISSGTDYSGNEGKISDRVDLQTASIQRLGSEYIRLQGIIEDTTGSTNELEQAINKEASENLKALQTALDQRGAIWDNGRFVKHQNVDEADKIIKDYLTSHYPDNSGELGVKRFNEAIFEQLRTSGGGYGIGQVNGSVTKDLDIEKLQAYTNAAEKLGLVLQRTGTLNPQTAPNERNFSFVKPEDVTGEIISINQLVDAVNEYKAALPTLNDGFSEQSMSEISKYVNKHIANIMGGTESVKNAIDSTLRLADVAAKTNGDAWRRPNETPVSTPTPPSPTPDTSGAEKQAESNKEDKAAAEGAAEAEKERAAAGGQGDTSGADAQTKANEKLTESAKEAADAEKKKINVGEEQQKYIAEADKIFKSQGIEKQDEALIIYHQHLNEITNNSKTAEEAIKSLRESIKQLNQEAVHSEGGFSDETANPLSEKKRGRYINQKVDDNDASQYSYTEWLGYAQRRLVQQRIVGYNDNDEPIYKETSVTSTNFEQIEKETIRVDALILKLQADLEKGINLGKPTKAIEDMLTLARDYSEELGTELKKYYDEQGYLPGSEHIQKYLARHQNAMAQTEAQIQKRRDDEFYKSQQKRNKEIEDTDALIMKQEQKLDQLKKKYVDNANVELPDKALKNLELRYNSIMTETGRLQKQGTSSKVERESLEGMIKEYQRYAQQSIKDQKIASNLEADSPKVAKARLEENITRLLNKMKQTAMDTTEYERQLQGISDELNKPENAEKIKLPVYLKKKRNDFKEIEQKYKAGQDTESSNQKRLSQAEKALQNYEKAVKALTKAKADLDFKDSDDPLLKEKFDEARESAIEARKEVKNYAKVIDEDFVKDKQKYKTRFDKAFTSELDPRKSAVYQSAKRSAEIKQQKEHDRRIDMENERLAKERKRQMEKDQRDQEKQQAKDTRTSYNADIKAIKNMKEDADAAKKAMSDLYKMKKDKKISDVEYESALGTYKTKKQDFKETDLKKQIDDQMKIIENAEKLKTRLNQAEAAEARGKSAGEDVARLKEEVAAAGEAADTAKEKIDNLLKSSGNKKILGEDAVKDIQEKAETKLARSKKGSVSSVKALDNARTAAQTKEVKRQLSAYEQAQKEYFNLYSQSLGRSLTSDETEKMVSAGRTMVELEKQWNAEKAEGISLSEKQEQVSQSITSNAQKTKSGNDDFSKNQLKQIAINKEAFDLYNNIQSKIAKMSNQSGWRAAGWDDQVEKLRGQLEAVGKPQDIFDEAGLDEYRRSLQQVFKSYQEISKSSDWQPVAKDWQAKARNNLQSWMNSNKKAAQAYKEELKELEVTIDSIEGKGGAEEWNAKFQSIQQDALSKGLTGKTLGDRFKEQFSNTMTSLATYYLSFQDFIRYGREAISIVTELDTQLTEMRKVSNESLSSLKNYQLETFDIANQVGTTAAQIQSSTADWMRLGKELPEAKQMAALSTKLLNVSEFTDIKDATDALVSATQAYQEVTANDIVDKLNIIGNNYAVSTDELAQGLQNAGAVLKTQGNDLDKTLALLTAGNKLPGNTEMYLFEYI